VYTNIQPVVQSVVQPVWQRDQSTH